MTNAVYFAFIVVLPIVAVLGGLATLFAVGALFDALDHPQELQQRVESAFRQPPAAPRATTSAHYYQPYWRT